MRPRRKRSRQSRSRAGDWGSDVSADDRSGPRGVAGADVVDHDHALRDAPLIMADWLRPGQHVTAMGSDQEHKVELDPGCLATAALYVPDAQAQCAIKGELRSALAAGVFTADQTFAELGDVVAGTAVGRQSDDDITIADLTGTGVQDTAIATLARQRAEGAETGTTFTS